MDVTGSGGKGSARRKGANDEAYAANYDRIFKGEQKESVPADAMPFTKHSASELHETLKMIVESTVRVEAFDAFLSEYAETKDLGKALGFARCEWDF